MKLDCYSDIIGLANVSCECVDEPPQGHDTTKTGYYVADNQYGIPFQAAVYARSQCFNEANVWDYLTRKREEAYLEFDSDFRQTIYTKYSEKNKSFSGLLGKKRSNAVQPKDSLVGIRLKSKELKGACIFVSSIELNLNAASAITINVHSNEQDASITSFTVNTIAGQYTAVNEEVNLELPLYSDDCELEYYFSYTLPNGVAPNGNKFSCCGDKKLWKPYFDMNGLEGQDLDNLTFKGNQGYGLSIKAAVVCNELDWICELSDVEDKHSGNRYVLQNVIARAIQYKAGISGVNDMLQSNRINFYTSLNKEGLYKHRSRLAKKYTEHLTWLVENLPIEDNDCLKCKDKKNFKKRSILI